MSRLKIVGLFAAIVAVGALIVVLSLVFAPKASDVDSTEKVRLEIRCNRVAKITLDGRPIGLTPIGIYVTKSSKQVEIDATIVLHLLGSRSRRSFEQPQTMTKMIVPDHDQLIDFVSPLKPERLPDEP